MKNWLFVIVGVIVLLISGWFVSGGSVNGVSMASLSGGAVDSAGHSAAADPVATPPQPGSSAATPMATTCADMSVQVGSRFEYRGWPAAEQAAVNAALEPIDPTFGEITADKASLVVDRNGFWADYRGGDAANLYAFVRDQRGGSATDAVVIDVGDVKYVAFRCECGIVALYRLTAVEESVVRRNSSPRAVVQHRAPAATAVPVEDQAPAIHGYGEIPEIVCVRCGAKE